MHLMLYNAITKNRTYRGQKEINFPKGNPQGKGYIVFLCTPSFDDSLTLLGESNVRLKECYFSRYTIDYLYRTQIGAKRINENQGKNYKDSFHDSDVSKVFTMIPPTMRKNVARQKYNLIVDLGHWNELYFKFGKKTKQNVIIENYVTQLQTKMMDPEYAGYKKILLIPIDLWSKKNGATFGIKKELLKDPISIMMAIGLKFPQYAEKLNPVDIYLVDPKNGSFLLTDAESSISDKKVYPKFKRELFKLSSMTISEDDEETSAEIPEKKKEAAATIANQISSKIEDTPPSKIVVDPESKNPTPEFSEAEQSPEEPEKTPEEELKEEIDSEVDYDIDDDDEEEFTEESPEETEEKEETKIKKNVFVSKFRPDFSVDQVRRIERLQGKQNTMLSQTIPEMKSKVIEPASLEGLVNTKNDTILHPRAKNFTKDYNRKKLDSDIDAAVAALSKAEYPIFIVGKKVEDSSDTLNTKKTYTYNLEDYQGNKFSIRFDVPVIIDDHYIYLNGIRSIIANQLLPMPIIKSGPNEVQIIGMYNKIYLHRKETSKLDTKSSVIKKYFLDAENSARYKVKIGNCVAKNVNFDTPLDFDNLSKNISELTIGAYRFIFDLEKLLKIINADREKDGKKPIVNGYTDDNQLIVGYNTRSRELITVDESKGESVLDRIVEKLPEGEREALRKISPGTTRFTYIKAIMKRVEIPIIFFMLYCDGLTEVLRKIGVKYDVVEPGTRYDHFNRGVIKAKDKWILWDKYPFHNSLLLNGMALVPTNEFTYEELDSKSTYVDMVPVFFKEARVSFVLDQFKDFMLDPISIEVLKDMNLPTNLTELFVTAAIMLNNNKTDSILDMKNIRIRNNEILAQFVYKAVADAYLDYRKSIYKKKPDRLIVNKYLVTQNINGSAKTKMSGCKLIEGASSLNPILELEKKGAVSFKGPSGINRDDAYTFQKRAYNPSMVGIIGISSPNDKGVGLQRQLVLNPNIRSTRGYLEAANEENLKEMSGSEVFTPAELLSPNGVSHDDPARTAMAFKQSKYMVMTDDAEPVFVGNKVEAAIPYYLSRDFVVVAKDNGKVIAIEENIVVVEYKDGTRDSFSLDSVQQKNSAGGFYIESRFETKLKVGDTFKKGEVIAYNPDAFSKDHDDLSASLNLGVVSKIAIVPTYDEYEDSAPITRRLAERLATTIVMEQSIVIRKNARVDMIRKVGEHVNVGDTLAIFEDWQDDDLTASWIQSLSDELGQDVSETVATKRTSEYAGEIVDVKFYSAVDLDELSPTFKPYVKAYWDKLKKKNNVLNKYQNKDDLEGYKCGQLVTEKPGKTDAKNGKIFGRVVDDGVLVRFFIKHKDIVKKGDKITHYTAIKGIVSNVIDYGLEPYSEFRKNEPIDVLTAPGGLLARKTPSAILSMFTNKIMIELKRKVAKIYLDEDYEYEY